LKEQTLWDKHIFCTTKCCLNNPFLKNICFMLDITFSDSRFEEHEPNP
jgi:hypothetical protein